VVGGAAWNIIWWRHGVPLGTYAGRKQGVGHSCRSGAPRGNVTCFRAAPPASRLRCVPFLRGDIHGVAGCQGRDSLRADRVADEDGRRGARLTHALLASLDGVAALFARTVCACALFYKHTSRCAIILANDIRYFWRSRYYALYALTIPSIKAALLA